MEDRPEQRMPQDDAAEAPTPPPVAPSPESVEPLDAAVTIEMPAASPVPPAEPPAIEPVPAEPPAVELLAVEPPAAEPLAAAASDPATEDAPSRFRLPLGTRSVSVLAAAAFVVLGFAYFGMGSQAPADPPPIRSIVPTMSVETSLSTDASASAVTSSTSSASMMTTTSTGDWSTDCTDTTPSHYYVWCGSKTGTATTDPRDASGIVMVQYRALKSPVYNPVSISQYALRCYEKWLHEGDQGARSEFLKHAAWLRDKGMDSRGRFPYEWDHFERPLKAPWYSGMAQGEGMSVLIRAYVETNEASYLTAAKKALEPFTVDVSHGGVVSGGGLWIEEYSDKSRVLNGALFGMFGLHDLVRVTGDTRAKRILKATTTSLAANLGRYESNGAVLYALVDDNFSHPTYYRLQNEQLRVLSTMTADPRFAERAQRWETMLRAYPSPVFEVPAEYLTSKGRAVTMTATVDYVFPGYYPPGTKVSVTNASGQVIAQSLIDRRTGRFSFTSGVLNANDSFRFEVAAQPQNAPAGFAYHQASYATMQVKLVPPTVSKARARLGVVTPNGDGWAEKLVVDYRLGGSASAATIKIFDGRGKLKATVPGRVEAGKQAYQQPGVWSVTYDAKDASGTILPDGRYSYVVEAKNSMGAPTSSGIFFVDRGLGIPADLGTSPTVWKVGMDIDPFTPDGDGKQDRTDFGFSLSAKAWITIQVYDSKGRLKRIVCKHTRFAPGRHYVAWDGRDALNKVLPAGTYTYFVLASSGGTKARCSYGSGSVRIR